MKIKRINVHLICCYCVQSKPKMALSSVKYSMASSINFKYFEIRICKVKVKNRSSYELKNAKGIPLWFKHTLAAVRRK